MPRIIQVVLLVFEMIALSFLFSRISGIKLTWIKYVLIPFIYIFFGNYIPVYTNHNMECFRKYTKRRLPKWKSSFNVMSIIFSKFILIFFEKIF